MVSGPQYESAGESAFIRLIGGDAVGMSTVPEVVAGKHAGLRILTVSLISNKVILPGDAGRPPASHAEVLETTAARSKDVQRLVEGVLARWASGGIPGMAPIPAPHLTVEGVQAHGAVPAPQTQAHHQHHQHHHGGPGFGSFGASGGAAAAASTSAGPAPPRDRASSLSGPLNSGEASVIKSLREVDVANMTPLQALRYVLDLKDRLR